MIWRWICNVYIIFKSNDVDNAICRVLKKSPQNVVSCCVYTSHTELPFAAFWLDATSKDSWQYVTRQVKAKQNKKPVNLIWNCIYLLGIWYLERRRYSRTLHICICMDSIKRMKNIWEKKFHEIPKKTQLEFATHLNYLHSTYIIFGLSWWLRQ